MQFKENKYIIFKFLNVYIYKSNYKFKTCTPYKIKIIINDAIFINNDIGGLIMFNADELNELCTTLKDFL